MWAFVSGLFDTSGFPPRWQCGLWTPAHGWLHVASDLGVWAAYFVIPGILGYYLLRGRRLPFRGVQALFVAFILACGCTHLMDAVIFWWPAYRLSGALKLVTAVVSWATVFALLRVTPTVMTLRSPAELEAEIADRKRAEEALRTSEERFRHLVQGVKDYAIYMLDPAGHVVSWNEGAERITGYKADEVLGRHFSCFYLPEDVAKGHPQAELQQAATDGRYEEEGRRVRKDGSVFWAAVTVTALTDPAGRLDGFTKVVRNIDERRASGERLQASLHEKDVMLREIHHRVKNNLQIISTLLDLQSDHTTDPQTLGMFKECRGRVRSMALIHERLYRSRDMSRVDFAGYVRQLADDLFRTYRLSDERVHFEVEVNTLSLPLDTAVPCGLLLNELVSNCFKHAFPGEASGLVRVSLTQRDDLNTLVVADDGVGFPPGKTFQDANSFGLQLVDTLVDQLDGQLDVTSGPGTTFTVRFPTQKK